MNFDKMPNMIDFRVNIKSSSILIITPSKSSIIEFISINIKTVRICNQIRDHINLLSYRDCNTYRILHVVHETIILVILQACAGEPASLLFICDKISFFPVNAQKETGLLTHLSGVVMPTLTIRMSSFPILSCAGYIY